MKISFDEIMEWSLEERLEHYETLKQRLSTSELAKALFSQQGYSDDCVRIVEQKGIGDELISIAIKENCEDLLIPLLFNLDESREISFYKKMIDKGADEKKVLLGMMRDYKHLMIENQSEITEAGFHLELISNEIIDNTIRENWLNEIIRNGDFDDFNSFVRSLDYNDFCRLLEKTPRSDVERWEYLLYERKISGINDESYERISKFLS